MVEGFSCFQVSNIRAYRNLSLIFLIGSLELVVVTMLIGVNLMIFHKSMWEARAEKFMVYLQDPRRLFLKRYPSKSQRTMQ